MLIKKYNPLEVLEHDTLVELMFDFSEEERTSFNLPNIKYLKTYEESSKLIKKYIKNKNYEIYLVYKKNKIIGFYIIGIFNYRESTNKYLEIEMLYLNKGERGKGIGKFIISYLVNFYKFSEIIVRTAQKNKKAHKFYEKNGFSYCTNNSSEKVSVFYKKH